MRRLLKDRRAVTPVLSNVLLTVIAVAAMSLVASATYVITDNLRLVMGERVVVEDVWFTEQGVSIYLRNTGKVSLKISAVYVNFTRRSFTPLTLRAGEHGWLNVSCSWDHAALYHINVVTGRGMKNVDYYKAPL